MNSNILNRPWTTFKGKKVTFETIDHQHLSNIYWFRKVCWDDDSFCKTVEFISAERFNGQILPYRPHIDFKEEIGLLRRKGYLFQKDGGYSIVVNGKEIGEILTERDILNPVKQESKDEGNWFINKKRRSKL